MEKKTSKNRSDKKIEKVRKIPGSTGRAIPQKAQLNQQDTFSLGTEKKTKCTYAEDTLYKDAIGQIHLDEKVSCVRKFQER